VITCPTLWQAKGNERFATDDAAAQATTECQSGGAKEGIYPLQGERDLCGRQLAFFKQRPQRTVVGWADSLHGKCRGSRRQAFNALLNAQLLQEHGRPFGKRETSTAKPGIFCTQVVKRTRNTKAGTDHSHKVSPNRPRLPHDEAVEAIEAVGIWAEAMLACCAAPSSDERG